MMATPLVPWEQTPFYVAATDTRMIPGGPTTYAVARAVGLGGPNDVTSYHPGQHLWDDGDNLPSILYDLRPPDAWYKFKSRGLPDQKLDGNQSPMFEQHPDPGNPPRPLLDFKILPDVIGSAESALILEAWRRGDGRIRWSDITMRMDRANRPMENALNMRASRYWRPAYSLISWHGKGTSPKEASVLASLSAVQITNNTTRGTTPGLVNPSLPNGPRIPHPALRNLHRQGRAQTTITAPSSTAITAPSSTEDDEDESKSLVETSDGSSSDVDREEEDSDAVAEGCNAVVEDFDAVEEEHPHSNYEFGPWEDHPPWSNWSPREYSQTRGEKRKRNAVDDDTEDDTDVMRRTSLDLLPIAFEDEATDQVIPVTPVLYEWGSQVAKRLLSEGPGLPDDRQVSSADNQDLDRGSSNEVEELLSFACSRLPCITEQGALDTPTSDMPDFSDFDDQSDSNRATSQEDE